MDPITQTPPQQPPVQPDIAPVEQKKVGPIITILIVVLVLIIGALYLFASRIDQQDATPSDTTMSADGSLNSQTVQPVTNESDDVTSLEADLNSSTDGLDGQNF